MPPDLDAITRLVNEKQYFFLPYYEEIVSEHPGGISALEVKAQVAERVLQRFDFDVFDVAHSGLNPRTGLSYASQWANNLVSNSVLDEYMLVVRSGRATLYPGSSDNSLTPAPSGTVLTDEQASELSGRTPTQINTSAGSTYRRSLQLAERVRELNGHACAISNSTCSVFAGRDGLPYVEVHHVIPMALQGRSDINLDRTTNMAPLCPGCHTCLHRGHVDPASTILVGLLHWFEMAHGVSFQTANADIGFNTTRTGLLEMYGFGTGSVEGLVPDG
jgi:5-methylcytosine-specific restriction endonuclease McrA